MACKYTILDRETLVSYYWTARHDLSHASATRRTHSSLLHTKTQHYAHSTRTTIPSVPPQLL